MDSEIIYAKTAFGEEAMHQRTRVMQRNVRMVLILVDGRSTVADLSLKTGNAGLTETALSELEKGGFIESAAEQDSLWAEGKRVAQEIRSAAIDKAMQLTPSVAVREPALVSGPALPDSAKHDAPEPKNPQSFDSSISPFSMGRFESSELPGMRSAAVSRSDRPDASSRVTPKLADGAKASFMDRLVGVLTGTGTGAGTEKPVSVAEKEASQDPIADIPVSIKPIRRERRTALAWPLRLLLTLVVMAALAYLVVTFFPYQRYLPELQAALSQICGRPVTVRAMRVEVYPKPGLFLEQVNIGADNGELHIDEIRLQPEISTLFKPKKQFQDAVLRGMELSAASIVTLKQVAASAARPEALAGARRIVLENTGVSFGGLGVRELDGEAVLSPDGLFQSASLHSADRSLTVVAIAQADGVDVAVDGFGWSPSLKSPWRLDSVSFKGIIENGTLILRDLNVRVFGGALRGEIVLGAEAKPAMAGDVTFERIDSTSLGEALGIGRQLSGEIAGNLRFNATADAWPLIFAELEAVGPFSMQRGSIQGIDLAEAVRRVSNSPVQGGMTQFEQLSGKIRVSPKTIRFSGLNLVSGLMQSAGYVNLGEDKQLSGAMELRMRGSANQTRVLISIGGPLKSPELLRVTGE